MILPCRKVTRIEIHRLVDDGLDVSSYCQLWCLNILIMAYKSCKLSHVKVWHERYRHQNLISKSRSQLQVISRKPPFGCSNTNMFTWAHLLLTHNCSSSIAGTHSKRPAQILFQVRVISRLSYCHLNKTSSRWQAHSARITLNSHCSLLRPSWSTIECICLILLVAHSVFHLKLRQTMLQCI